MDRRLVVPLLGLISLAPPSGAQDPDQRLGLADELAAIAATELAGYGAPGMAVAVWQHGEPLLTAAHGTADAETGQPMAVELIGAAASLSKFVTAVAALALQADGLVDLEAPVGAYLPDLSDELGRRTLGQLLSHTAGFAERTPWQAPALDGSLMPVCAALEDAVLLAEPGEVWGYSNTGYTLAGCVLEAVAGQPFHEVVAERVFAPVGMARSSFSRLWVMTHAHAQGHDTRGDAPRVLRPFFSNPRITPAGELMSTVEDLNRLAQVLMDDGLLDGRRVLPSGLLADLSRVRGRGAPFLNGGRGYGLGLFSREHRGERVLEHEGIYPGFGASLMMVPSRGLSAVAIANGRFACPARTTQAAIELALGLVPEPDAVELVPLSPEAFAGAEGRYRSGSRVVELGLVEGRPCLVREDGAYPLRVHPHGHWEVPGDPSFAPIHSNWVEVVRAGAPGPAVFIRVGWRLHRREESSGRAVDGGGAAR